MASLSTEIKPGQQSRWSNPSRQPSDLDWLVPMAAICVVQVALWFWAWRSGFASPPLFKSYGILAYTILGAVGVGTFLFRLFRMARGGEDRPLLRSIEFLRHNLGRILVVLVAVQVFAFSSAAFSALKTALPSVTPFWLDPPLAALEERLLGSPPWMLSHQYLGWATPAIDLVYATWLPVQTAAFYAIVACRPSAWKTKALVTYSIAWLLLGIGGAYLFSSAGPIFYDRLFGADAFGGLAVALHDAPIAVRTSDMLWRAYSLHTNEVASGISAMPSLHVALALWLALIFQRTRIAPVAWVYFTLIWIGSVHLGWHYVSDGLVGVLGIYAIWRAATFSQIAVRRP
jgi:hypothetical protein